MPPTSGCAPGSTQSFREPRNDDIIAGNYRGAIEIMDDQQSASPGELGSFAGRDDLHALIDTVPDAMIVIDTSGRILSFSKGAERMFGYAEADISGQNISILMPSPSRMKVRRP